jgi:hypothetical protein
MVVGSDNGPEKPEKVLVYGTPGSEEHFQAQAAPF